MAEDVRPPLGALGRPDDHRRRSEPRPAPAKNANGGAVRDRRMSALGRTVRAVPSLRPEAQVTPNRSSIICRSVASAHK